jgi:hypothetical protein
MNAARDHELEPPVLPELEQLLVRAARWRAAPRLGRRRWVFAVAVGALVLAAAAAAATGVIRIASGTTAGGTFSVERATLPGEAHAGSICLQLRYNGRGPSYGCGEAPTAAKPFGLVIADQLEEGSRERVIYGLVGGEVARVSALGEGGERTDAATEPKEGLPGRFFAVVVPHLGRIELVGYDSAGKQVALIGSLAEPAHPPHSKAEAVAQGDPAGFAPTVPNSSHFVFQGHGISEAEVTRRDLACLEGREVNRCYRSVAELEAALGERRPSNRYSYEGRIISEAEVHRLDLSCIMGRKANRCFDTPAEAEESALGHP